MQHLGSQGDLLKLMWKKLSANFLWFFFPLIASNQYKMWKKAIYSKQFYIWLYINCIFTCLFQIKVQETIYMLSLEGAQLLWNNTTSVDFLRGSVLMISRKIICLFDFFSSMSSFHIKPKKILPDHFPWEESCAQYASVPAKQLIPYFISWKHLSRAELLGVWTSPCCLYCIYYLRYCSEDYIKEQQQLWPATQ